MRYLDAAAENRADISANSSVEIANVLEEMGDQLARAAIDLADDAFDRQPEMPANAWLRLMWLPAILAVPLSTLPASHPH